MSLLKGANLALAFFLELGMLAAFFFWGIQTGTETLVKIILGVGAPLLVAVVWGLFLAPKSSRRLKGLTLHAVELAIFGLAALALAAAGQPTLAAVFAAVAVMNQVLLVVWKQ
jgi:Zn-dependent protease